MLKRFRFILTIIILSDICTASFAQKAKTHVLTTDEAKIVKKDAATMFSSEDFDGALKAYQDLYKAEPQNPETNFRLGYCYLVTSVNKRAALKHLEFATQSKEPKKEWLFYLGLAYMYNERWDEASKYFSEYKESSHKPIADFLLPERLIEMCKNAKELTVKPVNCTFTNLGKTINTSFEEYNPFISADGRTLIFTSRRKGNVGGFIEDLGIYTADIFSSVWKDTLWGKPRTMGANINSEWDEESVGLSPAADQVMIYFDNAEAFGDIGVAVLKSKMWQRPVMYLPPINTKQFEGGAALTSDGNTIYFSSDRKDGQGENDLWVVKKENGQFGNPVNLGNSINTPYDDENPYLSVDGKRLYFSSKGWNSMGGSDIFYSDWNENDKKWSKPVNMGYPINDADDNSFFSTTGDERFAYIAVVRSDGFGDKDIYMVEFKDTMHHPFKHVISGQISGAGGRIEVTKVALENKKTSALAEYIPGPNNLFVFAAEPGDYTLKIEGYNFAPYAEDLTVGNEFPPIRIEKNIQLKSAK